MCGCATLSSFKYLTTLHGQTFKIARSLTDRQFGELFAIAQVAPGPNIMFVALLGHFIAGAPRRGRNSGQVRTELCPRLRGVAGCRALSQSAPAHSDFRPVWCRRPLALL